MTEKYLDLRNDLDYTKLKEAGRIIRTGGLVLFPTETVYGLGANGLDPIAVKNIFLAKGRTQDNPLILHIADKNMLQTIVSSINEVEKKLMDAFWPGPFTIILERKEIVPDVTTGGLDTVGVRMPSGVIARELIRYANVPIAAPSANVSGRPSGTRIEDIMAELGDRVDYTINGGDSEIGVESTVVRVENGVPHVLRPGKVTAEQIQKVIGQVIIDPHIMNKLESDKKVMSPGMKYRHYAPETPCILVYSENNRSLVSKMQQIAQEHSNPLIIATHENTKQFEDKQVIDIGAKGNLDEIAKNIFTTLRKVDQYHADVVIIEGVKKQGVGLAIMNRLIRACEYQYIEC